MTEAWIAEEDVVFVHPDGGRSAGRIAVGVPHQASKNAWCTVALEGLERSWRIAGDTTLQALLLAIRFLGMRLHDFVSRGGRVLFVDEGNDEGDLDVPLASYFGSLLRGPEAPPSDANEDGDT